MSPNPVDVPKATAGFGGLGSGLVLGFQDAKVKGLGLRV